MDRVGRGGRPADRDRPGVIRAYSAKVGTGFASQSSLRRLRGLICGRIRANQKASALEGGHGRRQRKWTSLLLQLLLQLQSRGGLLRQPCAPRLPAPLLLDALRPLLLSD